MSLKTLNTAVHSIGRKRAALFPLCLLLVMPSIAFAGTITTILGFFNIGAGVMLVTGILIFLGGFIGYLVLLGTERRKEGLYAMVWGLAILFVLAILLGIIDMLEGPLSFLLGMAVVIFLAIVIIISLGKGGGDGKKEDKKE